MNIGLVIAVIKDSIFIDFVLDNHTPPRAKLIFQAVEGILSYNVLDIVPELEEVILDGGMDTSMKIGGIKETLIRTTKEIMNALGIIPYKEVSDFKTLSKIINGIDKALNEYYPDYILENTSLDNEDEPDIHRLYSVIQEIENLSEVDFHDSIHSLREGAIVDMCNTLKSKVVTEIETDSPDILDRYKSFIKGVSKGVVRQYISLGGKVGVLEPQTLLELMSEPILSIPPADRPFDIVSALKISTVEDKDMYEVAMQWAAYFSDNESEQAVLERAVESMLE